MTENDCFRLREKGTLFRRPPGLNRCHTKLQQRQQNEGVEKHGTDESTNGPGAGSQGEF